MKVWRFHVFANQKTVGAFWTEIILTQFLVKIIHLKKKKKKEFSCHKIGWGHSPEILTLARKHAQVQAEVTYHEGIWW